MPKQLQEPDDTSFGRLLEARCFAKARKAAGNRLTESQLERFAYIGWAGDSAPFLRRLVLNPLISTDGVDSVAALKAIVAAVQEKEATMATKTWAACVAVEKAIMELRIARVPNPFLKGEQKIPVLEAKEIARKAGISPELVRKAIRIMRQLPRPKKRRLSKQVKEALARGRRHYGSPPGSTNFVYNQGVTITSLPK